MKLLLDTHTILWAAREPERLSARARAAIKLRANERLISTASLWELGIKFHKGKLHEAAPLLAEPATLIAQLAATALPIAGNHALAAPALDWDHIDPFDRMLAAQALAEGAALVSVDRVFDALADLNRLW